MSILVNKKTKVVVHGITGSEGSFHASQMIEYGSCRCYTRKGWEFVSG